MRLITSEMSEFFFVCFSSAQNLDTHPPIHPAKGNLTGFWKLVFWMTEDYLPGASPEEVGDVSPSSELPAVRWSGNTKAISALNAWPLCHRLLELFWTSLTPTITPCRTPTPHLFTSPLKNNKPGVPHYGADFQGA